MDIKVHDIIRGMLPGSPLLGLYRVLWIRRSALIDGDIAIVIEIKTPNEGAKNTRYWLGPREVLVADLLQAIADAQATILAHCAPPQLAHLTDEEIRRLYPKRTTLTKKRFRSDSAAIQTRDRLWTLIEPIVRFIETDPEVAYKNDNLRYEIGARLKETGRPKSELLNALHRYLALRCGRNALLPDTAKCGGRGRARQLKNALRLGRKSATFKAGLTSAPGIHLTEHDRACINLGWNTYLKDGLSVRAAYILTLGTYWVSGFKLDSGKEVPVLLPSEQRPTLRQFRYWGPRQPEGKSAFNLLLRPNEYEKKYRPTLGTALDGVRAVGQIAIMDSTSTDQALVSILSPLDAVGTCNRNVIHEGLSDVICGIYCGFEAPSAQTSLLTILNAASDKVEFCKRFGVTILPWQIPSIVFMTYLVDNAEMRSVRAMEQMRNFGSVIQFAKADAPYMKPGPESGHRVLHRLLDRRGDGKTNGRQRARGEKHSAVRASWTWYVYMRELIRGIVYYNCYADASALMNRHPFRTEMARDNVPPTRAGIYAWCVKNNRIASPPFNLGLLKATVLPTIKAVVNPKGVHLLRPDRGRKRELVIGARYSSAYTYAQGWHEGNLASREIEVKYDPSNLSSIWYSDHLGFHRLDNLDADEGIKREGTLRDYLDVQDRRANAKQLSQDERDQGTSDILTHIEDTNLAQRAIKEAAKKSIKRATGKRVSDHSLTADIKANRERETRLITASLDPITRMPAEMAEPTAPPTAATELLRSDSEAKTLHHDEVTASLAQHRRRNAR
jgi:putative transposase